MYFHWAIITFDRPWCSFEEHSRWGRNYSFLPCKLERLLICCCLQRKEKRSLQSLVTPPQLSRSTRCTLNSVSDTACLLWAASSLQNLSFNIPVTIMELMWGCSHPHLPCGRPSINTWQITFSAGLSLHGSHYRWFYSPIFSNFLTWNLSLLGLQMTHVGLEVLVRVNHPFTKTKIYGYPLCMLYVPNILYNLGHWIWENIGVKFLC